MGCGRSEPHDRGKVCTRFAHRRRRRRIWLGHRNLSPPERERRVSPSPPLPSRTPFETKRSIRARFAAATRFRSLFSRSETNEVTGFFGSEGFGSEAELVSDFVSMSPLQSANAILRRAPLAGARHWRQSSQRTPAENSADDGRRSRDLGGCACGQWRAARSFAASRRPALSAVPLWRVRIQGVDPPPHRSRGTRFGSRAPGSP